MNEASATAPSLIDDRLRRFDHRLDPQRARRQAVPLLEHFEQAHRGGHLLRHLHLRHGDDEILRQLAAGLREQRGDEDVERANAARAQVFVQRLDADADERRQRTRREAARHFRRARGGVAIFLGVGAVAVAVLEIEPEIFHRLAPQLLDDAGVDLLRQAPRRRQCRAPRPALAASGAYSSSERSATAPSFCAESALKRCAPP